MKKRGPAFGAAPALPAAPEPEPTPEAALSAEAAPLAEDIADGAGRRKGYPKRVMFVITLETEQRLAEMAAALYMQPSSIVHMAVMREYAQNEHFAKLRHSALQQRAISELAEHYEMGPEKVLAMLVQREQERLQAAGRK